MTSYYNKLSLWQELDHYQHVEMKSTTDTLKLSKLMEQERIFEFQASLNLESDQVRAQILDLEPFPSLREVYA